MLVVLKGEPVAVTPQQRVIAIIASESSTAKKVKRQLTVATFEKWQRLYEQEHQMLTWLRCKRDRSDSTVVESLFCEVCKTFEGKYS